jgi:hypothetical protein
MYLNTLVYVGGSSFALGLYRAYWLHQLTWAPFNGIYFACYEKTREFGISEGYFTQGTIANLCSGIVAGTVASTATSPIDLVKVSQSLTLGIVIGSVCDRLLSVIFPLLICKHIRTYLPDIAE